MRVVAGVATSVALLLAAGCTDPTAGVVVDRSWALVNGVAVYRLHVRQDSDGQVVRTKVRRSVYQACTVGKRWPDCGG
jgi:hypothetical protein